ncbi:SHOCT domain-containing protein [Aeromonas caviae]|uniref:SHOCT domain-containing protein n=1 Tax=Aeromonas caviae TaxID=648 RepID=UPI0038D129C5
MKNKPLNSSDQLKLLVFTLLMIPSIIFVVGIIPAILLAFGIFTMKRNKDFSSVYTAVEYFKRYVYLVMFVGIIIFILEANSWHTPGHTFNLFLTCMFIFVLIPFLYLIAVQHLFFSPLKEHSDWISVNGLFSIEQKSKLEVDIVKGNLTQYSVADELNKWAKLKEDGYITEEEFNEARAKLLGRY